MTTPRTLHDWLTAYATRNDVTTIRVFRRDRDGDVCTLTRSGSHWSCGDAVTSSGDACCLEDAIRAAAARALAGGNLIVIALNSRARVQAEFVMSAAQAGA
jgi:hypothetical protein